MVGPAQLQIFVGIVVSTFNFLIIRSFFFAATLEKSNLLNGVSVKVTSTLTCFMRFDALNQKFELP